MSGCPDHVVLLNGLLDGELDAANTVRIETHLATCTTCTEALCRLQAVRDAIASPGVKYVIPSGLRDRIEGSTLVADSPAYVRSVRVTPWLGGGAIGALAASLAFMISLPRVDQPDLDSQLVDSHVRSLLAQHIVDVQTSNQHVVRPWFNGRTDYAPPVPELADLGFPLVGGRLDVIAGRVVPALVYRRRLHTVNLFVLPDTAGMLPHASRRDGYNLVEWSQAGLRFAAVSDIEAADLDRFRRAFSSRSPK